MNNLAFGLTVALIGILVVFVGLMILIGCIMVLTTMTKGKQKKQTAVPEAVPREPVPAAPVPEDTPAEADGSELAAVIAAAVASVWESKNGSGSGFVVRRITRIGARR